MIRIKGGFEFETLYCYPNLKEPLSYYYLPGVVQPQRDAAGKPMLTVVTVGSGGFLQLSVTWDEAPEVLEALRQELARRESLLRPETLRLSFAPVAVQGVTLSLGDGNGNFSDLAGSASSGYPPYAALFSVQLGADQQAKVMAALNGREGFLHVRYEALLQAPAEVKGTLSGDTTRLVTQLKETNAVTAAEVEVLLRQALHEGDLQLIIEASEGSPARLAERVQKLVLAKAAQQLLHIDQGGASLLNAPHLKVTASLSDPVSIPLQCQTDAATWFVPGAGPVHLYIAPGSVNTPLKPQPQADVGEELTTVRLGFLLGDAPLGMVLIRCGSAKEVLEPPTFDPVTLRCLSDTVTVETSYTTGGPTYTASLPVYRKELVLAPADLGMARVTVDARPLEEIGVKKVRVWLRYRPEGPGEADERTLHFRNQVWHATWFLITQASTLGGTLDYEWQATTANGGLVKYETASSVVPNIVLTLESDEA